MGLFDFIKEAGSKIMGADEAAEPQSQTTTYSPEEIQKIKTKWNTLRERKSGSRRSTKFVSTPVLS